MLVGLPGLHRYIAFISGRLERVVRIVGTSREKFSGNKGTETMEMSFMHADTLYIPYVGGQVRIEEVPGMQKQRSMASIASSEPTPTNRFEGVRVLEVWVFVLRRAQRSCLRSCW